MPRLFCWALRAKPVDVISTSLQHSSWPKNCQQFTFITLLYSYIDAMRKNAKNALQLPKSYKISKPASFRTPLLLNVNVNLFDVEIMSRGILVPLKSLKTLKFSYSKIFNLSWFSSVTKLLKWSLMCFPVGAISFQTQLVFDGYGLG